MSDFLAYGGWSLVAAALALWWGERSRRIDAQRREERQPVIQPPPPKPAEVRSSHGATPEAEAFDEGRESYIQRAIADGYSPEEASADWDAMMERASSDVRIG